MFQYTTETIINSNEGALNIVGATLPAVTSALTGVRFAALDHTGCAAGASNGVRLLIDGVNLLQKGDGSTVGIIKVTRRAYKASANEDLTIPLGAVASAVAGTTPTAKVVRLKIETAQEGLVTSTYADAQLRHKKPFFYEVLVPASSTASAIADLFVAAIKKEMALTDFPYFKAENASGDLKLVADDVYTRFRTVQFAAVPAGAITRENFGNALVGWEDFDVLVDWARDRAVNIPSTGVTFTLNKGTEGNGTVARLIKNIKLPTDANTDPFAADNGGRPMPGAHYDEYVIEYVSDRRHIGGQVVGALDRSLTTHVLWLAGGVDGAVASATGASAAFYAELQKMGLSVSAAAGTDMYSPIAAPAEVEAEAKVGSKQ